MQVPQTSGSHQLYAQPGDPRSSSPYPPSPYQHPSSPPGPPYQAPYDQPSPYGQQYGQASYPPHAPSPQHSYAAHDSAPPAAGYGHHESQYGPPHPGQSPYQQQEPYYPAGSPTLGQYGSAASYMSQDPEGQASLPPPPGTPPDGERGVMGTLAGGAAGAWAGHKLNHGVLGALGGAFAGHKLQSAAHNHNKHKPDKKQQFYPPPPPPPPPPQQQQGYPPVHHYAGNFSGSSTRMSMDGDYNLFASCKRVDGTERLSSISLNGCLTNTDGHFHWARGGNFGASARNVRLVDGGRTLEAELKNCSGGWVWDRIALDERIGNNNGDLILV